MNFFEVMFLQAGISVSVDMLPLPGGMGISEGLFMVIFKKVFGEANPKQVRLKKILLIL